MEIVANSLVLPCNYSTSGCAVSVLHTERRKHEESCEFRPYSCPLQEDFCIWEGSLEEAMPHLIKCHDFYTPPESQYYEFLVSDINQPGPVYWECIQLCFGHNFIMVLKKLETLDVCEQFCATVQLIGTRKQAENFAYKLELRGQRRRLTWEATTTSIHERFSAIMNSDCLVFDSQPYADKGNLSIYVSLFMV
jgi:E3 ubiquitin-protein ligase SIAH1